MRATSWISPCVRTPPRAGWCRRSRATPGTSSCWRPRTRSIPRSQSAPAESKAAVYCRGLLQGRNANPLQVRAMGVALLSHAVIQHQVALLGLELDIALAAADRAGRSGALAVEQAARLI